MNDYAQPYRERIITFIEHYGSDQNFKKVIMVHDESHYKTDLDLLINEQLITYKEDVDAHVITEKGKEYTESKNISWLEL